MKKDFLPYYISRAILSLAFAILAAGISWITLLLAILLFGLFLLYLHSGWFRVDLRQPLTPLRRDQHGQEIQRKALIISIVVGLLIYLTSPYLSGALSLSLSGNVALSIGIITYFTTQFVLFART
ncbi:MAG: hypothetical protein JW730_05265 [Anaerolineales bacterium]|nr:hypothetical protein [Anaerolineales bacterium]